MKANEMQRYRYQNDFPNDYDGIVDDKDGELVFYEDAMQVIQALEAKIKGMIERPKVEVVEVQWGQGTATLEINGVQLFVNRDEWDAVEATFDTQALGMEGSSDGL